jgi:dihydrodipicolinate synthase/N-acetylneuraminate lyase
LTSGVASFRANGPLRKLTEIGQSKMCRQYDRVAKNIPLAIYNVPSVRGNKNSTEDMLMVLAKFHMIGIMCIIEIVLAL